VAHAESRKTDRTPEVKILNIIANPPEDFIFTKPTVALCTVLLNNNAAINTDNVVLLAKET
jgi:hypothetical protein